MNEELNQSVESTISQPGKGLQATGTATNPVQPQNQVPLMNQVNDLARSAIRRHVRGLSVLGEPKPATAPMDANGSIYDNFVKTFSAGTEKQNPTQMTPQQPSMTLPQIPKMQGVPKTAPVPSANQAAQDNAPKVGGSAAQVAGVTMRRVGGRDTYGYKNADGVSFDLPDGIDVNDDAAVNAAIDDNNYLYNTMNELYSDEEV